MFKKGVLGGRRRGLCAIKRNLTTIGAGGDDVVSWTQQMAGNSFADLVKKDVCVCGVTWPAKKKPRKSICPHTHSFFRRISKEEVSKKNGTFAASGSTTHKEKRGTKTAKSCVTNFKHVQRLIFVRGERTKVPFFFRMSTQVHSLAGGTNLCANIRPKKHGNLSLPLISPLLLDG